MGAVHLTLETIEVALTLAGQHSPGRMWSEGGAVGGAAGYRLQLG